jgi:hypothetical protein
MNKLKELYKEFVSNNKNNLFVFGLDSFRFQSKLIDIEYDDMKRLFLAITNASIFIPSRIGMTNSEGFKINLALPGFNKS